MRIPYGLLHSLQPFMQAARKKDKTDTKWMETGSGSATDELFDRYHREIVNRLKFEPGLDAKVVEQVAKVIADNGKHSDIYYFTMAGVFSRARKILSADPREAETVHDAIRKGQSDLSFYADEDLGSWFSSDGCREAVTLYKNDFGYVTKPRDEATWEEVELHFTYLDSQIDILSHGREEVRRIVEEYRDFWSKPENRKKTWAEVRGSYKPK